jgi:hypothetical protein
MNFWNQHDLTIMEIRENAISLKEEFDKKKGTNIKNYSKKLNLFLDKRLKKESDLILKRHMFMVFLSLAFLNRKIYK